MSATDHTKHYSAADIQRYLAGELSPADMHALELAALDDPFLADAIEGMQQSLAQKDKTPIDTGLQELQRRLQERVAGEDRRQSAPVVAFRWWQVAAAAAVIIIGSIWVFNASQESHKEGKDIAMVQTQEAHRGGPPAMASDSVAVSSNNVVDSPRDKAAAPSTGKASSKVAEEDNAAFNVTQKADDNVGLQKAYKPLPTPAPANFEGKASKQQDEIAAAAKAHQPAATRNTLNYEHIKDDTIRVAPAKKMLANQRTQTQANHFSNNASRDFEQIIVSKTPRDTSAAGYLSKPRELAMNMSRKELSARQAKKNPDALLSGFVSGRVTDNATNSPISNAIVRIEGARDFFTDNKGFFKIPVTDSVVNVAVGTSGYYTQNVRLNNNSSNLISLNQLGDKAPNPTLNVLQGRVAGVQVNNNVADTFSFDNGIKLDYTTDVDSTFAANFKAASSRSKSNPLAQHAEPVYGWVKFQQYLDQNKQLPANGTAGAGKVVLTFEVDKKGAPAAISVVSSPGQAYSDEAIRLIKAGPSWKLLKGRKGSATVVITF